MSLCISIQECILKSRGGNVFFSPSQSQGLMALYFQIYHISTPADWPSSLEGPQHAVLSCHQNAFPAPLRFPASVKCYVHREPYNSHLKVSLEKSVSTQLAAASTYMLLSLWSFCEMFWDEDYVINNCEPQRPHLPNRPLGLQQPQQLRADHTKSSNPTFP